MPLGVRHEQRHIGHMLGMPTDSAPRLPDLGVEVRRWVLDNATQLAGLRSALLESIAPAPRPPNHELDVVAEKMLIVATELATNGLKYGLPPTIVRLCRIGEDFLIDVVDHDPATRPEHPPRRSNTTGGLGLRLTRTLAFDVGWYRTVTTKHMWARFRVPPD